MIIVVIYDFQNMYTFFIIFSLKVPAYERFHALAQPSPSDTSTATLPLPYKYKTLAEMFRCTDTVLNLLGQRKEKCTYPKLRDAVQQMSRK